ncbi:MAG: LysR substrate-binding domain-containing protein [Chloroflexota bacterium]
MAGRPWPAPAPHWNLHRLRVFLAVARGLSFTAAARELAIAQPAVSHQVRALEDELGVRLFQRHGRTISLTEEGESLFAAAGDALARLDDGARAMAEIRAGERGAVDISADTTSGIYVVPAALGALHRARPALEITLHVENRRGVLRRLTDRTCDLAVMADPPPRVECDVAPFLLDRLVVVAAPDHPLVGRSAIDAEVLGRERLLVREPGSGTRAATERFFARRGRSVPPGMELGSTGAIKQAVAAGLGVAVVSGWAIDLELRLGRLAVLDVAGFPVERRWSIVNLRSRRLSPAATFARAFLADYASRTGPIDPTVGGDPDGAAGHPDGAAGQPEPPAAGQTELGMTRRNSRASRRTSA